MAQCPQLALLNYSNQDIWSYYELLQINPVVSEDHLVIILQAHLVDMSLIMNMYKDYNLPIPHPTFQNTFHYSVEGDY